jgi:hypothetical protein
VIVVVAQMSDVLPDICWRLGPAILFGIILLLLGAHRRSPRREPRGFEVLPAKDPPDRR